MPTDEFRKLLDREFSKAAVQPIVEIAGPLLRELVNAGLMVFRRCEVALLSALLLVRGIKEMIQHFRRGENLEPWYMRDVRPLLSKLTDLKIRFNALPEE